MGTSRCWQDNVVNGFGRSRTRKTVAERKKIKRLLVRKMVKDLKTAGKHVDLQTVNQEALFTLKRKKMKEGRRHTVLSIR